MTIQKISAFSMHNSGGNPAGVLIADTLPDASAMQRIAADIGYSESVFAAPKDGGWRVRYFSPESEVPFCGHATIALGAALAMRSGDGTFALELNDSSITVSGTRDGDGFYASLQSPNTESTNLASEKLAATLALFGYTEEDLDPRFTPAFAKAGATHFIIVLNSREKLAQMSYDLDAGRDFMRQEGLVTIAFIFVENDQLFHTRNAFASGGVLEDPATGASSAAFAGYLRDIDWPHNGSIRIIQGEDMGQKSEIFADISATKGASIKISGAATVLGSEL